MDFFNSVISAFKTTKVSHKFPYPKLSEQQTIVQPTICLHKKRFTGTHLLGSFIYIMSTAIFMLQQQR